MHRTIAASIFAAGVLAGPAAQAEPNDNFAGTLSELSAARAVTVQLPPVRPVSLDSDRRAGGSLEQDSTLVPRRALASRSLWINYGTGF